MQGRTIVLHYWLLCYRSKQVNFYIRSQRAA